MFILLAFIIKRKNTYYFYYSSDKEVRHISKSERGVTNMTAPFCSCTKAELHKQLEAPCQW